MAKQSHPEPQNPIILRCHRLMQAFAKSDDERSFYLDNIEGFLVYVDLDKSQEELDLLSEELKVHSKRYLLVPKMTFYETKKLMDAFVSEKVYDVDTKEKLIDIIQSKEARENFLEFIHDHHTERDKWQQFYLERARIYIIEWLRSHQCHFVFEEDLDLPTNIIEKLKQHLFDAKIGKELQNARKVLTTKAKTYYSNEALHPKPKRGRPPKEKQKVEVEQQNSRDIYTQVVPAVRPFLFTPDIANAAAVSFSSKFEQESELHRPQTITLQQRRRESDLQQKIHALRTLAERWEQQKRQETKHSDDTAENFEEASRAQAATTTKKKFTSKTANAMPPKTKRSKK